MLRIRCDKMRQDFAFLFCSVSCRAKYTTQFGGDTQDMDSFYFLMAEYFDTEKSVCWRPYKGWSREYERVPVRDWSVDLRYRVDR